MASVLITGSAGYLGSNLCNFLSKEGYEITKYTRNSSNDDIFGNENIGRICANNLGSIKFDIILHCATLYKSSYSDLIDANILFPTKIFETSLKEGGIFINFDTSLYKETNFYAYTKNIFLEILKYSQADRFRVINLVLQYFYSGSEPENRFLKSLVTACLRDKYFNLTEGKQIRDFIYMSDLIDAIKLILDDIKGRNIAPVFLEYEIGSGKGISIKELSTTVKSLSESDISFQFGALPYRKNETMYSVANIRSLEKLGWKPKVNLMQGLNKVINSVRED